MIYYHLESLLIEEVGFFEYNNSDLILLHKELADLNFKNCISIIKNSEIAESKKDFYINYINSFKTAC